MKGHKAVHELLGLAVADALSPKEQRQVQEHLLQCEACRIDLMTMRHWYATTADFRAQLSNATH
jgi:anti-sigma factor RsiW